MTRRPWSFIVAALLSCTPAPAAFHLMKVVEVFPGTEVQPNAQYVVLQMYASGQQLVSGHSVKVYGPTGAEVGSSTFAANLASGANQSKILIATAQATAFFGVTADLAMSPVIPLGGGAVCFDNIDCVAWGNFSGTLPSAFGTPLRECGNLGLDLGTAIVRRLNISGGTTTLDSGDDTNNSANDFEFGFPAPRNNAGVTGTVPFSACGNGSLEGLEACDDSDTDPGDGCSAACEVEACGNCLVELDETCEPPSFGACSATCELGPPLEVSAPGSSTPVRFTSHTTLVWQDATSVGATSFNVYTGTVADVRLGDYGSCFASPVPANTTTDATDPAVGVTRTYLVTAKNSIGEGPAGDNSQPVARTFVTPCP